jgi:hypothetical protein
MLNFKKRISIYEPVKDFLESNSWNEKLKNLPA